jgi:hypothetical protein
MENGSVTHVAHACQTDETSTGTVPLLDRGTVDRTVTAKDTTVPGLGLQDHTTAFTIIKELAGIGRHFLFLLVATFGTGDLGAQQDFHSCPFFLSITL